MSGKSPTICHYERNEVKRSNRKVYAIASLRDRSVPLGNAKGERNDEYLGGHHIIW